ncbi:auxin-responsive protein IAA6-like isoform X2 [Zingiber officinale]|uniref:auxin-responsive protein IAA6-like isoform X2 n=1 Tax=Zingiber officinale TaxID=94328 RepID=UPI001C4D637E|nr:auxin-responsive protein IAA6-like isoform X2 [Zingiber officinale]
MEREDFKKEEVEFPRLLDLIPNERVVQDGVGGRSTVEHLDASEEKKLELRLGLPGGDLEEEEELSILSLGFISKASKTSSIKRGVFKAAESKYEGVQHQETEILELQSRVGTGVFEQQQRLEKEKADGAGPSTSSQTSPYAMPSAAAVPAVGWPPIRSFRKKLVTNSGKQRMEPGTRNIEEEVKLENNKGLLVKINMDGIPIGRKVDLKVYDSYEKLSFAVEDLFLGLLEEITAQKDTSTNASQKDEDARKAFIGLLDGSGEYTLVYEDNEGHRMLVGDVPWEMFVSTVKRLRVLKSSDFSSAPLGSVRRKRTATEC